jgi:hypothetical protein
MKISNRFILLLFALFVGITNLLSAQNAYAQKSLTASTDEEIIISFYKTGNSIPNFSRWIKNTAPYIHTPWAIREKIHEEELYRLQLAYQTYNPKKDHLIVKTKVHVEPIEISPTKSDTDKTYKITSKFANAPNALYFPYQYLDERIVIMPYHLEDNMNTEIEKADFDFIDQKTDSTDKVTAIFRMQPHSADLTRPHKIDGLEQWVLMTKIISIEYWAEGGELLWENTVPWYDSKNTTDIKNLYKDRPEDSKFKKGRVKPVGPLK